MTTSPEAGKQKRRPLDASEVEALLGGRAKPAWRRWAVLAGVLALAAVVGGAFWLRGPGQGNIRYTAERVTRGPLKVVVTATGSAQPITQVNISSELSGTVRKVRVDYNSVVKAGDVLAELDIDKLTASVENARAKLEATKAHVVDALATIEEKSGQYERRKALAAKEIASAQDLDLAKAAYDRAIAAHTSALAEVRVAQADLQLQEINLKKACICAPIDGVVLKRSVDPGQIVASSLQAPVLFVIAGDLSRMELQVDVDEADVGKVEIGQRATFMVDAHPERKFPATIRDVRYGSEIVQGVVTYKAVLAIDNTDLLIRPGMTATAEIAVKDVEDAILVPNTALRFSPAQPEAARQTGWVQMFLPRPPSARYRPPSKSEATGSQRTIYVLADNAPVAVPVSLGVTDGRYTQILKGDIAPDQRVITDAVSPRR